MTLNIDLPKELEDLLRSQFGNLNDAAKEAALVEFYRQGNLTHHQFAGALGLSRYEADGVLKRHGITYELSLGELDEQLQILRAGRAQ